MKINIVLALVAGLALAIYLLCPPAVMAPSEMTQQQASSPIAEALKSVCEVRIPEITNGGTMFLVGRKHLEDGTYRYVAITAAHVLDDLIASPNKTHSAHICFSVWGAGMEEYVVEFSVGWFVPAHDWATVEFVLPVLKPCLQLASKQEIDSVTPEQDVYTTGSAMLDGVIVHKTNIASLNNLYPTPDREHGQRDPSTSPSPWHRLAEEYMRLDHESIPGDSGCPVFNSAGRVIGMVTAHFDGVGLALRVDTILMQAKDSDLFVVEK